MNTKHESRLLIFSFIFMIISYSLIFIFINRNFDFSLAEMHFFLTPTKFIDICNNFSRANLKSYIIMATSFDVIWPISYCSFFFFLNYKINYNKKNINIFNSFLLITFFLDMIENMTTLRYLQTAKDLFILPSVIATNLKWLFISFIIIYLIYRIIILIKNNSVKKLESK